MKNTFSASHNKDKDEKLACEYSHISWPLSWIDTKNKEQLHSQARERSAYQLYLVAFRQKGNFSLHGWTG